jgi:hypothetical protein
MSDIIGTMLTTPRHSLAVSALPAAPVVEEVERHRVAGPATRAAIATALRALGSGSRRLADRIEPAPPHGSTA